ncbi:MAG: dihydrolipoyl dehydrogenase [Opitutales bacterium]|nr:dihydrolipoyl dehydrogenase [Opitutales bacterium]
MAENVFDLIVIGAGPGGYVCAIRGAQLGLNVALIDKRSTLGGTCLNIGCIPTKALLHSTEHLHFLQHQAAAHGIVTGDISVDLGQLMQRKNDVVARMTKGVEQLCKARKITVITGSASLGVKGKVSIQNTEGTQEIEGHNIVLASGSVPIELPFLPFDGETVISSDEAMALDKVPEKLVVVGAGAIGLELGSVWARLGSEVSIVEFLPEVAPNYDTDISKQLARSLKKQKLKISTQTKVTGLKQEDGKTFLTAEKGGKEVNFEADKILVAVGRKAFAEGLGLAEAGVETDERGRVKTDEALRTTAQGIWAIGDLIAGAMLAHKAEEEGIAVAERIAGKHGHVNYNLIPNVIYTEPEVAGVGLTEKQAKEQGYEVAIGKFNVQANSRAVAADKTDGIVKVITDAKTDRILGAQIVATGASELIAEITAHMLYGGSAEDMGCTVHAHPTVSECLKEAGLAANGRAIHGL